MDAAGVMGGRVTFAARYATTQTENIDDFEWRIVVNEWVCEYLQDG